jgi:hypothetical protein
MKVLVSAVFAVSCALGAGVSECPESGGQPICQYRNGYLLKFDRMVDRVIRVCGPDGRFRLNLPINLPGAAVSWAYDVAIDSDGSFVAGQGAEAATGGRHPNSSAWKCSMRMVCRPG